jgi:hypothetical protein
MTVHPPPSDAESQQWFTRYDRGQKGHVTLEELHSLLNDRGSSLWAPFDQDTGKIIVSFILTGGLFLVEMAPGVGGDENPSDTTRNRDQSDIRWCLGVIFRFTNAVGKQGMKKRK